MCNASLTLSGLFCNKLHASLLHVCLYLSIYLSIYMCVCMYNCIMYRSPSWTSALCFLVAGCMPVMPCVAPVLPDDQCMLDLSNCTFLNPGDSCEIACQWPFTGSLPSYGRMDRFQNDGFCFAKLGRASLRQSTEPRLRPLSFRQHGSHL